MNFRDFEIAPKKERTRLSPLAIIRKLIKERIDHVARKIS